MIYYVVGIHKVSHNEHVVNSYSNLENAIADKERYEIEAPTYDYRVDTVLTKDEIAERNARIEKAATKLNLNREFGRAKMDHEEGYTDSDSIRTKDFTIDELFPAGFNIAAYTITCTECACEVKTARKYVVKHTEWHNKLLP